MIYQCQKCGLSKSDGAMGSTLPQCKCGYTSPPPRQPELVQAESCGYESCDCRSYCKKQQAPKQAEQQEPVAWMESPYGAIRANPLYKVSAPQSISWSIPLYTAPPRQPLSDEHPLVVFAKECVLGAYREDELADAAQRAMKAAHGKENT